MGTVQELEEADAATVMIPVQNIDIRGKGKKLSCLFDSGSNFNILSEAWADKVGLTGVLIVKTVYTAGGDHREWKTKLYSIPLSKITGEVFRIIAMGMRTITEPLEKV